MSLGSLLLSLSLVQQVLTRLFQKKGVLRTRGAGPDDHA